ncbi:hypothetical protein V5F89_08130 [Pelagerythrobacter marensis]|uniref:Uncharacterized protein n=1 Tax=Pelagerythrobacter marensis TaxID=543877 RepID=A0ABZ2D035_9SPHN
MSEQIIIAAAALVAIGIVALAALHAWQGWLALKTHELDRSGPRPTREIEGGAQMGAARIEIADLKERIRKLEAIASGVDP